MTTAAQVLDMHTALYERWKHPSEDLVRFLNDFMDGIFQETTEAHGGVGARLAFSYMFWPCTSGEQYASMLARQLYVAPTYQVTAEMMDAVTATYEQVVGHVGHMEEREAPGPSGFCYFDKPLVFESGGAQVAYRAISWCQQSMDFNDGDGAWPGVRIAAWASVDDNEDGQTSFSRLTSGGKVVKELGIDSQAAGQLRSLGPLFLGHSLLQPFEERFNPRKKNEDATLADVTRWLHTLWMFLQTELTVVKPSDPVERHARKRAMKSLNHSDVSVVLLRRIHNAAEPSGEHHSIDWSCRWVVQGHDRHLEKYEGPRHHAVTEGGDKHCATCQGRTTYVRAYLKGPDGLPLRAARQLYKLAR